MYLKDEEDVKKGPIYTPNTQPGDLKFEDVDGNGKITTADKTIVGSPFPDFTWDWPIALDIKI